jgi:hypothetical protein
MLGKDGYGAALRCLCTTVPHPPHGSLSRVGVTQIEDLFTILISAPILSSRGNKMRKQARALLHPSPSPFVLTRSSPQTFPSPFRFKILAVLHLYRHHTRGGFHSFLGCPHPSCSVSPLRIGGMYLSGVYLIKSPELRTIRAYPPRTRDRGFSCWEGILFFHPARPILRHCWVPGAPSFLDQFSRVTRQRLLVVRRFLTPSSLSTVLRLSQTPGSWMVRAVR